MSEDASAYDLGPSGDDKSDEAGAHGSESEISSRNTILSRLYATYFDKLVKGLITAYGPGPPDPQDVAHEAFARMSARSDLQDLKNPEGYAWICARNIVIAHRRSEAVHAAARSEVEFRLYGGLCDKFDPERVLSAKEELDIVMETIEKLPTRRRNILLLCRAHGLTPAEAGKRCGVTRTSAVRHIANAMAAIEEALAEYETFGSRRDSQ